MKHAVFVVKKDYGSTGFSTPTYDYERASHWVGSYGLAMDEQKILEQESDREFTILSADQWAGKGVDE